MIPRLKQDRHITLGVVQAAGPAGISPHEQWRRITPLIHEAAAGGADLILLPELILCPYFCQQPATSQHLWQARMLAEPVPGTGTGWFTPAVHKLACELDVAIVASVYERGIDQHFFNTSFLSTPQQEVAGKYRKVHLPEDPKYWERSYFQAGTGFTQWPTTFGQADVMLGPMVCYDQWYPEAARVQALAGAELLMYPTAIGFDAQEPEDEQHRQLEAWRIVQQSHAVTNMVFVAAANRVGVEGDLRFWGHSLICEPGGHILAEADGKSEQVLLAELALEKIGALRKIWPLLADRVPQAYGPLLNPSAPKADNDKP